MKSKEAICAGCSIVKTIEVSTNRCMECLINLVTEFRSLAHEKKSAPILEAGRGKWYFYLDKYHNSRDIWFVTKEYWETEKCACEYHHLPEEDMKYINSLPIDMGLADEISFELGNITTEDARTKLLELGLEELIIED